MLSSNYTSAKHGISLPLTSKSGKFLLTKALAYFRIFWLVIVSNTELWSRINQRK